MRGGLAVLTVVVLAAAPTAAVAKGTVRSEPASGAVSTVSTHEVTTWAASDDRAGGSLTDITVRNPVHISVGGSNLRVRLSNASGTEPITFSSVYIGRPVSLSAPQLVAGSNRRLTFGGATSVTIPGGAVALSDPLPGYTPAGADLAVSVALSGTASVITAHNRGMQYTFKSATGDFAADESGTPFGTQSSAWYWLDGIVVDAPNSTHTVAALGDSITDGVGSTINANHRWTDYLADRLPSVAVANEGISGNRLLAGSTLTGPAGAARFVRDVSTKPGVTTVVVFEGINDISGGASAGSLIAAYRQLIAQGHAMGRCIVGATITPAGYAPDDPKEQARRVTNTFIRSGAFDHVVDFDAVVRDPAQPSQLLAAYDSGDHIHPDDAAYQAMAAHIGLAALRCH